MLGCILDTETTALVSNSALPLEQQPYVIEFCGVLVDDTNGEEIAAEDFFIKPPISIPPEITKITGLSDKDVQDALPFCEKAHSINGILDKCDYIVAHNLSYDFLVIDCEFQRAGILAKWPLVGYCTVEASEWLNGFRLNLNNLHKELFGDVPEGTRHRARADVDILVKCWLEMKRKDMV